MENNILIQIFGLLLVLSWFLFASQLISKKEYVNRYVFILMVVISLTLGADLLRRIIDNTLMLTYYDLLLGITTVGSFWYFLYMLEEKEDQRNELSKFRELLDSFPMPIWAKNNKGVLVYSNPVYKELYGDYEEYADKAHWGKYIGSVFYKNDQDRFKYKDAKTLFEPISETENAEVTKFYAMIDGKELCIGFERTKF